MSDLESDLSGRYAIPVFINLRFWEAARPSPALQKALTMIELIVSTLFAQSRHALFSMVCQVQIEPDRP